VLRLSFHTLGRKITEKKYKKENNSVRHCVPLTYEQYPICKLKLTSSIQMK
jgi:hypothetical protein